jgi:hypothetical protein
MGLPTKSVNQQNFPSQVGNRTIRSAPGRNEAQIRNCLNVWDMVENTC